MEIYVFDKNLNFSGIIDAFTSLILNRRYLKCGDFEFHCDLTLDNLNLLAKGNLIWKQGDKEAGYINYRDLKQDSEGKEFLVVKGKFLTNYLNRRIIWDLININDTVENVMRTLVNQNCINPTDSNRVVPNLMLGGLKGLSYSTNYQQSAYSNLNDEIENLSIMSELGHRIRIDPQNKKLLFEVYAGIDRSINQADRSPCIFSKEFENILEQEFTDSNDNIRNVALINGMYTYQQKYQVIKINDDNTTTTEDKTEDIKVPQSAVVGNAVGLDRYEEYVDGGNISNPGKDANGNDVAITQQDALNMLIEKGNKELAQYKEIQTFDSKINGISSNIIYKTDFDLGDIVTCTSKKWGITLDTRITEIQEIYEESGQQINVTFGNSIPTLIDKIKQKMR